MKAPATIQPMLATLIRAPYEGDGYIHEIKWDGYRIIAYKEGSKVRLLSRGGQDYTNNYPVLVSELKKLKADVILDGEVCVLDSEGIPSFDALQKYAHQSGKLVYYSFDLIWKDGKNFKGLPLLKRKDLLKSSLKGNSVIRYSDHFDDGVVLYEKMKELGLEGIVSKRADSTYKPGIRGSDWYKTPTKQRQEFVIGAWAESDRGRSFRSILFGAYNKTGQLEWVGRSGGGYKQKDMPDILKKLKALEIKASPFVNKILDSKGAVIHYVKPKLVANFEFSGFTSSGRIRKPATWLGFRDDKNPKDVVREISVDKPGKPEQPAKSRPVKKKKPAAAADSNWPAVEKIKITSREKFDIGDCTIEITNVEKELWSGIPKAELIQYYHSVCPYIMPYLKGRPLSLHLKPYHPTAPGLYIKDMEGRQPDCADIFTDNRRHRKKGKRDIIDYLVCNNEATLLWAINLGCIDLNPWNSTTDHPNEPDYIVIDLDPTLEDVQYTAEIFTKVVEIARATKEVTDKHGLKTFVKTSGKTGMHIYIPSQGFNYEQARAATAFLCDEVHAVLPKDTTRQNSIQLRGNRVFVDDNQNDYADTLAAPYCARPFHLPTVSTPLDWREVKPGLTAESFTLKTILKRLQKKGDLFSGLLDPTIAVKNSKSLSRLT